jgi:hypothetical protein
MHSLLVCILKSSEAEDSALYIHQCNSDDRCLFPPRLGSTNCAQVLVSCRYVTFEWRSSHTAQRFHLPRQSHREIKALNLLLLHLSYEMKERNRVCDKGCEESSRHIVRWITFLQTLWGFYYISYGMAKHHGKNLLTFYTRLSTWLGMQPTDIFTWEKWIEFRANKFKMFFFFMWQYL